MNYQNKIHDTNVFWFQVKTLEVFENVIMMTKKCMWNMSFHPNPIEAFAS
jgi:hypothetical protein